MGRISKFFRPVLDRLTTKSKPTQDGKGEFRSAPGGKKLTLYSPSTRMASLRKKVITDANLERIATRSGIGSGQVYKRMNDPWRNGYEIKTDVDELEAVVRQMFDYCDIETVLSRIFAYMTVYGCGVGYLDLAMGANEDYDTPVANFPISLVKRVKQGDKYLYDFSQVIRQIVPMSRTQINKVVEYDDGGRPLIYELNWGDKLVVSTKNVHRDRLVMMSNWWLSDDWKGRSVFYPQYDSLEDLEDMNVANVESFIKASVGLLYMTLPGTHISGLDGKFNAEEASADDWDWAESNFVDIDLFKNFLLPSKWGIESAELGASALNPENYFSQVFKNIASASGISKVILTGAETGQLTGSEYIVQLYHELVADWRSKLNDAMMDIVTRFQVWGILPKGEVTIVFNSLEVLSEKDKSETSLKYAHSFKITAEAILSYKTLGFSVYIDGDHGWMVKTTDSGEVKGFKIPGIDCNTLEDFDETKLLIPFESEDERQPDIPIDPEPTDSIHGLDAYRLTKEEKDILLTDWSLDDELDSLTQRGEGSLRVAIQNSTDEWLDKFTDEYKALYGSLDETTETELISRMVTVQYPDREIQESLQSIIDKSMQEGWDKTTALLGFPDDWQPGDPWASTWISANVLDWSQGIKTDINMQMLSAMKDGILKGEGYQKIFKRIEGASGRYTKNNVGKVVHKVVHTALNASRIEAYNRSGVTSDEKPLVYLTVGDERVRPEHVAREGNVYPSDVMEELLSEWNCRCTCIPQLAIERLRGQTEVRTGEIREI